jgi:hypothetical protein
MREPQDLVTSHRQPGFPSLRFYSCVDPFYASSNDNKDDEEEIEAIAGQ